MEMNNIELACNIAILILQENTGLTQEQMSQYNEENDIDEWKEEFQSEFDSIYDNVMYFLTTNNYGK